jgi:hypothetical protein
MLTYKEACSFAIPAISVQPLEKWKREFKTGEVTSDEIRDDKRTGLLYSDDDFKLGSLPNKTMVDVKGKWVKLNTWFLRWGGHSRRQLIRQDHMCRIPLYHFKVHSCNPNSFSGKITAHRLYSSRFKAHRCIA